MDTQAYPTNFTIIDEVSNKLVPFKISYTGCWNNAIAENISFTYPLDLFSFQFPYDF